MIETQSQPLGYVLGSDLKDIVKIGDGPGETNDPHVAPATQIALEKGLRKQGPGLLAQVVYLLD
jgi:hypothetical protein